MSYFYQELGLSQEYIKQIIAYSASKNQIVFVHNYATSINDLQKINLGKIQLFEIATYAGDTIFCSFDAYNIYSNNALQIINSDVASFILFTQEFQSFFELYDKNDLENIDGLLVILDGYVNLKRSVLTEDLQGAKSSYWQSRLIPNISGYIDSQMQILFDTKMHKIPDAVVDYVLYTSIDEFTTLGNLQTVANEQKQNLYNKYLDINSEKFNGLGEAMLQVKKELFGDQQHQNNLQKLRDLGLSI